MNNVGNQQLIQFRLDRHSRLPAYRQIMDQICQALRLGILRPGDKLPAMRDVVKQVAINPNTVRRAYRELEAQGLVEGHAERGTFVRNSFDELPDPEETLLCRLVGWLKDARAAGLDDESTKALIAYAKRLAEGKVHRDSCSGDSEPRSPLPTYLGTTRLHTQRP